MDVQYTLPNVMTIGGIGLVADSPTHETGGTGYMVTGSRLNT